MWILLLFIENADANTGWLMKQRSIVFTDTTFCTYSKLITVSITSRELIVSISAQYQATQG